jgi:hypothetical protein
MNVNLHIEKLVLEGLPVTSAQGPGLQAAVQAELARLLGEQGMRGAPAGIEAFRPAGSIRLKPGASPAQLGRQIADAVHHSLAPVPGPKRKPT